MSCYWWQRWGARHQRASRVRTNRCRGSSSCSSRHATVARNCVGREWIPGNSTTFCTVRGRTSQTFVLFELGKNFILNEVLESCGQALRSSCFRLRTVAVSSNYSFLSGGCVHLSGGCVHLSGGFLSGGFLSGRVCPNPSHIVPRGALACSARKSTQSPRTARSCARSRRRAACGAPALWRAGFAGRFGRVWEKHSRGADIDGAV